MTEPGRTEQHVLLGGRVILASEACLSVFDRGVLYGESVFETVKVRGGIPCLWEPHRDRLRAACVDLNLFAQDGVDAMITDLEDGIARLLNVHPVERGALRVQVTGGDNPGGARGLIAPMEERSPTVVAAVQEAPAPAQSFYEQGVSVVTAPPDLSRTMPAFKSGSYIASVEARRRAAAAGAFECLFTWREGYSEGLAGVDQEVGADGRTHVDQDGIRLLEGSFTSLIGWDGERLLFPGNVGCLPGVTREVLRAAAADEGIPWVDLDGRDRLPGLSYPGNDGAVSGLLLTSSLLGVCPCAFLDGVPLASSVSPATLLRSALHLREEVSRSRWLGSR